MVKIIGGSLRGRALHTLPGAESRPLLGRIKKSLFDILAKKLPGARMMDLFSGTGSVGIEALSRGASFCLFAEKDRRCLQLLEKNLTQIGLLVCARLWPKDVLRDGFPKIETASSDKAEEAFDIIFIGPPYALQAVGQVLEKIAEKPRLLAPEGWLIGQHSVKEKVPDRFGGFQIFRQESYGDTRLSFWKR